MPTVRLPHLDMHFEEQGSGEVLLLIPYLTADNTCYAFQVAEYAKHFRCVSVDLRGTGASGKPGGPYTIETLADDVAAFMQTAGIPRAHVSGLSLGAATGLWLAAKHPDKVQSLSVHAGWTHTDPFVRTVLEGWQIMARTLGSVQELVIRCIFPWCFTPDFYSNNQDYIRSLCDFVRSRPPQSVDAFIEQSNAVLSHDVRSRLASIQAPTLITFGDQDLLTSTRFAPEMQSKIRNSETIVFEHASHAMLYEKVDEFNARTLDFLKRHAARMTAAGATGRPVA
jgi:pimeloyl-ACP methyl ester carboxylesterase